MNVLNRATRPGMTVRGEQLQPGDLVQHIEGTPTRRRRGRLPEVESVRPSGGPSGELEVKVRGQHAAFYVRPADAVGVAARGR